jgi:hypothetical protein
MPGTVELNLAERLLGPSSLTSTDESAFDAGTLTRTRHPAEEPRVMALAALPAKDHLPECFRTSVHTGLVEVRGATHGAT